MQEVFRFIVGRPPRKLAPTFAIVLSAEQTSLGQRLVAIGRGEQARTHLLDAVSAFFQSPDFSRDVSALPFYQQFMRLRGLLERESHVSLRLLGQFIQQSFGRSADALVNDPQLPALRVRVTEAVVALKINPGRWPKLLAEYVSLLRLIDLVERIASADESLEGETPRSLMQRPVALPDAVFPLPIGVTKRSPPVADDAERQRLRRLGEIEIRMRALDTATKELSTFGAGDLIARRNVNGDDASGTIAPQGKLRALQSEIETLRAGRDMRAPLALSGPSAANTVLSTDVVVVEASSRRTRDAAPSSPNAVQRVQPVLRPEAAARLSGGTLQLLRALHADVATTSIHRAMERIDAEILLLASERESLQTPSTAAPILRVGGSSMPAPMASVAGLGLATPELPKVPTTVGLAVPSGVGRLLVVKQQIKRYETADISHVENILRSEKRNHETRRLQRTEETLTIETETTREQERDQQSTERMEMRKEAQTTISEDERFKIGATVSGGFGPFVQAEVSTEFETENAQEDSESSATSFARDVTQRTAAKITERVRREQTIRTIEEFEEKNSHGFDNTLGTEHVVGIYQWLDRVYEAQVYDYGIRMFFDVMVPEPAAFVLQALESRIAASEALERPAPFNKKPSELDAHNYHDYVRKYQVTDVVAPPPLFLTLSLPLEGATQAATDPEITRTQELAIPEGYEAVSAYATASYAAWEEADGDDVYESSALWFHIGRNVWRLGYGDDEIERFISLDGERQTLPVAMRTLWVSSFVATIEVQCRRTTAYEQWQLKTHAAIVHGYLKLQSAFEDKLAALSVQESGQFDSRNPGDNRMLERTELKRLAISTITGQYFEAFGAIHQTPTQEARIDFDEAQAEGRYARFFEQAFDWGNMTYELYPYFWGRRTTWVNRLLTQDVDPLHGEFLKAGYARLRIPVQPDFERGVFHFLDTGTVWDGGELPELISTRHLALMTDIKSRRSSETEQVPVGEPWDVRLPTTLIRVKPSASLPTWERNEEGEWLSVPD